MKKSLLLQEPNHENKKKTKTKKKLHYRSRKIKILKDVGVEGNKWRKMGQWGRGMVGWVKERWVERVDEWGWRWSKMEITFIGGENWIEEVFMENIKLFLEE